MNLMSIGFMVDPKSGVLLQEVFMLFDKDEDGVLIFQAGPGRNTNDLWGHRENTGCLRHYRKSVL